MIPGIVAGQMRQAGSADIVSLIAASGASYTVSGTTINAPATPPGIQTGDGLFAVLLARSTVTPPAGWTLISSQAAASATTTQTLYVYRKNNVTTGDTSTVFTWTQSLSGRMGLAYVACRSSTGEIETPESSGATTSNPATVNHEVASPILTATKDGELFIMAAGAIATAAPPAAGTWIAPPSSTLCTIATQTDNRLGVATQVVNAGNTNSSPWFHLLEVAGVNNFSALTIRVAAK